MIIKQVNQFEIEITEYRDNVVIKRYYKINSDYGKHLIDEYNLEIDAEMQEV